MISKIRYPNPSVVIALSEHIYLSVNQRWQNVNRQDITALVHAVMSVTPKERKVFDVVITDNFHPVGVGEITVKLARDLLIDMTAITTDFIYKYLDKMIHEQVEWEAARRTQYAKAASLETKERLKCIEEQENE